MTAFRSFIHVAFFLLVLNPFREICAQNVGIGTQEPIEKLDVNGNINLSGNLMVQGAAGQDGQILGMLGNTMQWIKKEKYANMAIYTTSGSFTVPMTTSRLLVEMWGAGGGGHNPGGGGGSGGYLLATVDVAPGNELTITIGSGGTGGGGNTNATSGGLTQVNLPGLILTASGGGFADSIMSSTIFRNIGGNGGLAGTNPTTFKNYIAYNGNPGTPTFDQYMAVSPTLFKVVSHLGIGGVAPCSGNSPDPVASRYVDENGVNHWSYFSISGLKFGNGGSLHPGSTNGSPGGNGRVVIYY